MTNAPVMPNFRRGGEAAKEAAARSGFARPVQWLSIEEDQYVALRFITEVDEWITVQMHNSVPTRPQPPGFKGTWPKAMSAVCRLATGQDADGNVVRVFPHYQDCFICDNLKDTRKPNQPWARPDRTWGLAILREEILQDGRMVGLRDKMVEVEENGVKKQVPVIVKIANSYKNFWGALAGLTEMRGTVRDLDYRVKRIGSGIDTDYTFAPYPQANAYVPDAQGNPTSEVAVLDLRDPRFYAYYAPHIPDLGQLVVESSDDRFYDTFFDTRHPQPVRQENDQNGAPSAVPPVSNDVNPAELSSIAERISSYGPTQAAQPVQQVPMQQPAPQSDPAQQQPPALGFVQP